MTEKKEENLEVFEILKKYEYLLLDITENLYEYFKAIDCWEKACIEIEIYEHCGLDIKKKLPNYCKYGELDCVFCPLAKFDVIDDIENFSNELKKAGYFVFMSRWCNLIISKIKSIAYHISHTVPWFENGGIRGLAFGYSIKEIKEFIDRTGQDEIKE